jgi:hypothetical protein
MRGLIFEVQKNIDVLFEINYEMSVLDMLLAFVGFVRKYPAIGFCRPAIERGSGVFRVEGLKTVWTN